MSAFIIAPTCVTDLPSRYGVAVHESAHAAEAAALGYAVTRCKLSKVKGGEFHGAWNGRTTARGQKKLFDVACILVAGEIGESLFDPNYSSEIEIYAEHEFQQAMTCATAIATESGGDRKAIFQKIIDLTAETLRANEPVVRAVAHELNLHGRIGAGRLAALLAPIVPKRGQSS